MTWLNATKNLQKLLERSGQTQRTLATALGIHEAKLSRALRSGRGLDQHWPAIAAHFAVSLDALCRADGLDAPPPPTSADGTTVPIIGEVTAGRGTVWTDADATRHRLPAGCALVRVRGRSGGNVIRDGQLALLAPADRQPGARDLVAVQTTDGQCYLKRWFLDRRRNQVVLTSLDDDSDPVVLGNEELGQVRVVIGALYE